MARFIDEEQIINGNAFVYEDKLNSQYTKFLDTQPTFVTYYSINSIESMVDEGFFNIEKLLGNNSPIRFNKIEHFPVFNVDQITPSLNEEEEGLTTSYNGDLRILPNTIVPKPNDFFIFNYMDMNIIFMLTEVSYETIHANGFYRASFTLEKLDYDDYKALEKQTTEDYEGIYRNIGTEDKCLIRSEDNVKMKQWLSKFD